MITVFEQIANYNVRDMTPGQIQMLRVQADTNLTRITEHYRRSVYAVNSDNILVQVLQHLPLRPDLNDSRYYDFVTQQSKLLYTALNLNSETVLNGPLPTHHFYGPGITEFIIVRSIDTPINFDASKYWESLVPVKVISHPFTDLNYNARANYKTANANGVAALFLDIGLLAIQYRHWLQAKLGIEKTIMQFVFQYPLVNMIPSDIDVSFFNRLCVMEDLISPLETPKTHGLALVDITALADRFLSEWLKRSLGTPRRFIDIPKQLPLLYQEYLADQLELPVIYFNRQNLGIFTIAFLPYLKFLVRTSVNSGSKDNGSVLTVLFKWYNRFVNGGYISAIPKVNPRDILRVLQDEVLTPLEQSQRMHLHD